MKQAISLFDTTLRDGAMTPGVTFGIEEKVALAKSLAMTGVNVIEAGFVGSIPEDTAHVETIANMCGGVTVATLVRPVEADIELAGRVLSGVKSGRINTFTPAGEMRNAMNLPVEVIQELITVAVKKAKEFTDDVQWTAQDATREDPENLAEMVEAAIKAGASTVSIADTVGCALPDRFGALIEGLYQRVEPLKEVCLSVHCHNDLGLAVANSYAAVRAGATQVECAVNGLGDRAGNAALEEVVTVLEMAGYKTSVLEARFPRLSAEVAEMSGIAVPANKPVVGSRLNPQGM